MKTFIHISRDNLIHNLKTFFHFSGKDIMLVVKANAYGHGLTAIVQIAKQLPFVKYLAVDSLDEAIETEKIAPKKPILIIGWLDTDQLSEAISRQYEIISPSLNYYRTIDNLAKKLGKKAMIHLKLETGTSRLGMSLQEMTGLFQKPGPLHIEIKGIYSHFANIEDTTDHTYAQKQLSIFRQMLKLIGKKKILKHFSCSASALLFPETYFDMIRIGISAYGYWPSKQTYISYMERNHLHEYKIELKPVLNWYARVAQIKNLDRGEHIGYGLTYQTFNPTAIAVVPVGYYDGYDRRLSNIANVLINGNRAPVRGRICMDMFMVEITHLKNIKEGTEVTLIGGQGKERIDADTLADLMGSINYEVLSRLNPHIPRIII